MTGPMKTKTLIFFLCVIYMLSGRHAAYAQVTIGLGEAPEKYATLQVKDVELKGTDSLNAPTASKGGILLPRVKLVKKNELLPFVASAEVNPPTEEYLKAKKSHTGLIVYNIVEDPVEDLCLGLNQWDGEQWNCFEFRTGNATAELGECNELRFEGEYKNGVPLAPTNYMTIPIKVSKKGAYTITARVKDAETNTDDNGYYFTISGTFLTTGNHILTVPGAGTPIKFTPLGLAGDYVTITLNGEEISGATAGCPKKISVKDSSVRPVYTMACSSVKVNGTYKVGQKLDPEKEFIELTLNVTEPFGAAYDIKTNTVDGIYFEGTGTLDEATQKIKLKGYGTPVNMTNKVFTITTNDGSGSATCTATVNMFIKKKRIYTLGGTGELYGYNLKPGFGANKVLTAPGNFGTDPTSTVKTDMANYEIVYGKNWDPGIAGVAEIKNELTVNKPDILYITQDSYVTIANGLADVIIEYLNNNGVVVLIWEANPYENGGAQILFRKLFNNPNIKQKKGIGGSGGSIFAFTDLNDDILNGPFGDVRGKYWGEDASAAMTLSGLPVNELDIYSYAKDYAKTGPGPSPDDIVAFKHKTKNLIYVGDGGFVSSLSGHPTKDIAQCPLNWEEPSKKPIPRPGYGANYKNFDVYNSIMWCNIMAWAIQRAESNGINNQP